MKTLLFWANTGRLGWIPSLPTALKRWNSSAPLYGWRSLEVGDIPSELLTVSGIARDAVAEREAFETVPLYRFNVLHPEIGKMQGARQWRARLPITPLWNRIEARLARGIASRASQNTKDTSPEDLTREVRRYAAEIGLSAIGIARYDRKYIYAAYLDQDLGDRVVVCALAVNRQSIDAAPSPRAERAGLHTSARVGELAYQLGEFISNFGYRVIAPEAKHGRGITHHFAVESGLGQLGLNGQLLTPFAGSGVRLILFHTDAPLVFDKPRDYGVNGVCDACQACVRRCPSGAITSQRKMHRGVLKAKIKLDRCLPVIAQAHGCAVCSKVCPVQRYGLPAVLDEYRKTGRILGRDTDELEGYTWPLDGRHYGPGEKPRIAVTKEFLSPGGFVLDAARVRPPASRAAKGTTENSVADM